MNYKKVKLNMIIKIYKCDLCKVEVLNPYDGYRLVFSGDGAISFVYLDDDKGKESIVCKHCVRGLRYAINHMPPKHPREEEEFHF